MAGDQPVGLGQAAADRIGAGEIAGIGPELGQLRPAARRAPAAAPPPPRPDPRHRRCRPARSAARRRPGPGPAAGAAPPPRTARRAAAQPRYGGALPGNGPSTRTSPLATATPSPRATVSATWGVTIAATTVNSSRSPRLGTRLPPIPSSSARRWPSVCCRAASRQTSAPPARTSPAVAGGRYADGHAGPGLAGGCLAWIIHGVGRRRRGVARGAGRDGCWRGGGGPG